MNPPIHLIVGRALVVLAAMSAAVSIPRAIAAAPEPLGLPALEQFERLPYLKLDTLAGSQTSFDRNAANNDYSNYLYTNGSEKVLVDLRGPGTVYRFWCTGFNADQDEIKIYFDGETTPRVSMPLRDMFAGTHSPFLTPLVGDDTVSSGGFYCYLPLSFRRSIRITSNATSGSFYYNFGYHIYAADTAVTSWTGSENSQFARDLWSHAGSDPGVAAAVTTVADQFDLPAGQTRQLLDIPGPNSISGLKLRIPGTEPLPQPPAVSDEGRAHKGYSQFVVGIDPKNQGLTLTRRFDYGVANQTADVFVDGVLAGRWVTPGSDQSYHWRDASFSVPASLTANKSTVTIKVNFISSDLDWNEFRYWVYSLVDGQAGLSDTVDVGNAASEDSHHYTINNAVWEGSRSFQYPPPAADRSLTAALLTNLWLQIKFDNETNPSVLAPIGSFFGMGQFSSYATRSLPVGLDDQTNLYCYFPMPFVRRATVDLISRRNTAATNIHCEIDYRTFGGSFANVGCFKTQFHTESPTTNGWDILMLDVEGAGHLVGVVESMAGPLNRGYLEGNERFYVDDSRSPAINGTGTEDFYNAGWYFSHGLFTAPLHGNTSHVVDANTDYTSAYRLFLQDAVPFRKHLRAGIQHGPKDDVPIHAWTLAYYYLQSEPRAVLTDELHVGDGASEAAHAYAIQSQTWIGKRAYTYEYEGVFNTLSATNTGRAHKGYSEFRLGVRPSNTGAILRRLFDQGIANQEARVFVDGVLVGNWYFAGGNPIHNWREDDFQIPASYVAGKTNILVRIEFVSSALDWNEFAYRLYSLVPPKGAAEHARLGDLRWEAPAGTNLVLTLAGATNAAYDLWCSADLRQWQWLGTATESAAATYHYTDFTASASPCRFYRAVGP